ncbi:unnamed protein product [Amoebophrya sp. A25]|nr:unnamed protein product [Amoebophrya sp. A25]|eukprot:GSA25T00004856001.1
MGVLKETGLSASAAEAIQSGDRTANQEDAAALQHKAATAPDQTLGDANLPPTPTKKQALMLELMNSVLQLKTVAQLEEAKTTIERIRKNETSDAVLKIELLEHLRESCYVKIGSSSIEGCGVIAIRDIPEGVDPFHVCNADILGPRGDERSVTVRESELDGVADVVKDLVKGFFAPLTDDEVDGGKDGSSKCPPSDGPQELEYGINATGLNTLSVGWYLNHSDEANLEFEEAVEAGAFCTYKTRRKILAGEELFIDYRDLGPDYYKMVMGK